MCEKNLDENAEKTIFCARLRTTSLRVKQPCKTLFVTSTRALLPTRTTTSLHFIIMPGKRAKGVPVNRRPGNKDKVHQSRSMDNKPSSMPKTVGRTSSIKPSLKIDIIDEEQTHMTDQVSVSDSDAASAASSRGGSSHGSSQSAQHPLLDFMGVSCTGSDWFTNCFPCAIVPILDDDVADKVLSRENAMNAMYAKHDTSSGVAPIPSLNGQTRVEHSFDSEQGTCIVQLPQEMVHGQSMSRERSHISLFVNLSKSGDELDERKLSNGSVVNKDSSKLDIDIPKPKMKKRTISIKKLFGRKETKI